MKKCTISLRLWKFLFNTFSKWKYVNPSASKLLESDEDIIGKPIWDNLHSEIHKIVEERIRSSKNGIVPMSSEQTWMTQNGNRLIVEVIGFPLMFSSDATQVIIRVLQNKNLSKKNYPTI